MERTIDLNKDFMNFFLLINFFFENVRIALKKSPDIFIFLLPTQNGKLDALI